MDIDALLVCRGVVLTPLRGALAVDYGGKRRK
jgi:hypothetical protein